MNTKDLKEIPDELLIELVAFFYKKYESAKHENALSCDWFSALGGKLEEALKPNPKVVDMSVFIDSGVDCEFRKRKDKPWLIAKLDRINTNTKNYYLNSVDREYYYYCLPRMNYWFSDYNFECSEELIDKLENAGFEVKTRKEAVVSGGAFVTAFKIIGVKEGYILSGGEE